MYGSGGVWGGNEKARGTTAGYVRVPDIPILAVLTIDYGIADPMAAKASKAFVASSTERLPAIANLLALFVKV